MLSSGLPVNYMLAQRLQQHIASSCALPWPVAGSQGTMLSVVLPSLRRLLDSAAPLPERAASHHVLSHIGNVDQAVRREDAKTRRLIGSLAMPVVMPFAGMLEDDAFDGKHRVLDVLLVAFHKVGARLASRSQAESSSMTARSSSYRRCRR